MSKFTYRLITLACNAFGRMRREDVMQGTFLDKDATLDHLAGTGESFIRMGDGEFIAMLGGGIYYQKANSALAADLRRIVDAYRPGCGFLLGLPHRFLVMPNTQIREGMKQTDKPGKFEIWYSVKRVFQYRFPKDMPYGETLLFRRNPQEYQTFHDRLWADARKLVVVNSDPENAAFLSRLLPRAPIDFLPVPSENAYAANAATLEKCLDLAKACGGKAKFLLAAGPAAKPIALELSRSGIVAYDVGHFFKFLRKRLPAV